MIKEHEHVDIIIDVVVGKSNHHAIAIDRTGKKLLDRALPQDEAKIWASIKSVADKGTVLLVVDQPSTIGALPVAVARAEGILVCYLPAAVHLEGRCRPEGLAWRDSSDRTRATRAPVK